MFFSFRPFSSSSLRLLDSVWVISLKGLFSRNPDDVNQCSVSLPYSIAVSCLCWVGSLLLTQQSVLLDLRGKKKHQPNLQMTPCLFCVSNLKNFDTFCAFVSILFIHLSLSDPEWGSCSLGVFICLACSGVHRNIPSIGKVKSLRLSRWEDSEVQVLMMFL